MRGTLINWTFICLGLALFDVLTLVAWLVKMNIKGNSLWYTIWLFSAILLMSAIRAIYSQRVYSIANFTRTAWIILIVNFSLMLVLSTYQRLDSPVVTVLEILVFMVFYYIGWWLYRFYINVIPATKDLVTAGLLSQKQSTVRVGTDFGGVLRSINSLKKQNYPSIWKLGAVSISTGSITTAIAKSMERDTQLLILIFLWFFLLLIFGWIVAGISTLCKVASNYETEKKKTLLLARS